MFIKITFNNKSELENSTDGSDRRKYLILKLCHIYNFV